MIIKLIEDGYLYFCAGGALGFDTLAAQTVLDLKSDYPQIQLILVLPCLSQADSWSSAEKVIYEKVRSSADKVVYTSKEYTKGCMHKRNRHLVDNSSACICYLTEDTGGTAYTVKYAKNQEFVCNQHRRKIKKAGIFSPPNRHLFRKVYNSTKKRPNPL